MGLSLVWPAGEAVSYRLNHDVIVGGLFFGSAARFRAPKAEYAPLSMCHFQFSKAVCS
jgi:hypothetical protein